MGTTRARPYTWVDPPLKRELIRRVGLGEKITKVANSLSIAYSNAKMIVRRARLSRAGTSSMIHRRPRLLRVFRVQRNCRQIYPSSVRSRRSGTMQQQERRRGANTNSTASAMLHSHRKRSDDTQILFREDEIQTSGQDVKKPEMMKLVVDIEAADVVASTPHVARLREAHVESMPTPTRYDSGYLATLKRHF